MASFDVNYPENIWQNITTKTRDWYVPDLYRVYIGQAIYNQFINVKFNMAGLGAAQMFIDNPILPLTSTDPIGARDLWLDDSYMDAAKRTINFSQYGGKFSYHKYDNMITYWRQDQIQGLRRLIDLGMGHQISWTLEKLARNALLTNPFATYGSASGSAFQTVATSDIVSTQTIRDMWLGMKERGTPYSETSSFQTPGDVICLTSPGVMADLLDEISADEFLAPTFTDAALYADPNRVMRGEVGTYQRTRFIESNLACLYNCGAIIEQPTITSPINAGDGAPDPTDPTKNVDTVWSVGQPGNTHYITVSSATGINVGDIVTLHKSRTNANGVTNGVDFTDGKLQNLRVVAKSGNQITFATPSLVDYTDDLGGGVYAYLTKGRNIHTMIFLGANFDGVVNGIMQPPLLHMPDPVDDRQAQFRFTWDAYLKYQLFNPGSYEVVFLAGSNRYVGARHIQ